MRYVKYTINELMNITEADFVSALFEHTENRRVAEATHDDEAKIESWKDCLEFLKRQFASRDLSIMGEVAFCFEYKIFDGTWIDAVIVCENKIILLEFKSGTNTDANILDGHRSQINGYYNKVARCNKVIWEERNNNPLFSVERFLVYTNPTMRGRTATLDYIKIDDEFQDIINVINDPAADERVEQLMEFEEELDITTTGVMRMILNRRILNAMYVQDDNVTACANIVEMIQNETNELAINLIFIKGAPGTGKTGTGFSLLERYIDRGAKYVTGNGNLEKIFSQMIREDEIAGAEAAIVGSLHDIYDINNFCRRHLHREQPPFDRCNNKILIIDEAQRVWNPIQIAVARKNHLRVDEQAFVIENEVSEPLLVLRAVLQSTKGDRQTRTVVFLMGSGQEIYIGEEDGERYIQKAVESIKNTIDAMEEDIKINVYVPTEAMRDQYNNVAAKCEIIPDLLLNQNKRNEFNNNAIDFVNDLIDKGSAEADGIDDAFYVYNDYGTLLQAVNAVNSNAFSVGILACGFDTQTRWVNAYGGRRRAIKYINLLGEEVHNIDNNDLMNFYIEKTCNDLNTFASQFNCQGLELDYSIMIWGSKMLWRADHWELSADAIWAVDDYATKLENLTNMYPALAGIDIDRDVIRDTFIKNSYRVLLTRSRIATYIYIEDRETYEYIKNQLGK